MKTLDDSEDGPVDEERSVGRKRKTPKVDTSKWYYWAFLLIYFSFL